MSQQLTQSAFVASMNEKFQLLIDYCRRLPVAVWRGAVLFLVVAWIVQSAASLFWVIFPKPELEQPSKFAMPVESPVVGSSSSGAVKFESLATLSKAFGDPSKAVAKAPVATPNPVASVDNLPETKLRLKLHGLFASSDPKLGSAIIADGSKQVLYSTGEEIEGNRGVKLAEVFVQRVILDNKGRRESLWLFSEDDAAIAAAPKSRKKQTAKKKPPAAPGDSLNKRIRPDQIPKNIGDVVRFSVHREGGQMVGYRIRPGRDRELFNQVGLKANDIVTEVNGIEVNDPKQIRSVYKSMKTATEAHLAVLRDGDVHYITISLDSGG